MGYVRERQETVSGNERLGDVAKLDAELSGGHPRDLPMRMMMQRANGALGELDAHQHQVSGVRQNFSTQADADGFPRGLRMQHERLIAIGTARCCEVRQNRSRR